MGSTRATPVVLLAIAALLLAARVALGVYARFEPPAHAARMSYQSSVTVGGAPARAELIEWRQPGAGAEAEASAQHRPLLYDFSAEWCAPCRAMEAEVFADAAVAQQINSTYIPVRVVDREREEGHNPAAVDALQRRYDIQGFPMLVAVSPDGARHDVLDGYRGSERTRQWLFTAALKVMSGTSQSRSSGDSAAAR